MFSWLFRKKDKYVLVKTLTINGVKVGPNEGNLHFYLYESESGKRKAENKKSGITASDNFDNLGSYCTKIYPWLQGQDFKDIPSYWDIVKEHRQSDIKRMYKRYFNA